MSYHHPNSGSDIAGKVILGFTILAIIAIVNLLSKC